MKNLFTSESVTCGHPDKVCDQIADKVLDTILTQDPEAHVACETTCTTNQVHIFGEISANAHLDEDIGNIVRRVIEKIGYTEQRRGFDASTCDIRIDLDEQSPDIALGVRRKNASETLNNGAGDQGMMFGFACRETDSLMPMPIELAHSLAKRLENVRRSEELSYLLPDGKTQVTVEYEDDQPVRVDAVIVSAQHRENVDIAKLRSDIIGHVILPTLPRDLVDNKTQFFVNPTGRFVVGGPAGDSGLTGRKLMVDTYGGCARHGGGAFSGKDASKVDRSGAYMARYIAKNVVASGLADTCEVQMSYSIGLADPVSMRVEAFGTEHMPLEELCKVVRRSTDCRPEAIIERFGLKRPIFSKVSCYGHFGTNASTMPWEATDLEFKL